MKKTHIASLAVALMVTGAVAAFAGGERCKAAAAKQAKLAADCGQSAEDCLSSMAVKIRSKGWLGIETEKDGYGRYEIARVESGSPAEVAGFRAGDVLLAINSIDLYAEDKSELKKAKQSLSVGSEVSYKIVRDGAKKYLEATLAEVPSRIMAQWIGEHMLDQHAHLEVAAS